MRYILADKEKAIGAGFLEVAHRTNDKVMLLNENEVLFCPRLDGDLETRVEAIGGKLLTQTQAFLRAKRKGKYKLI